jgi:hypothetical protein
MHKTTFVEMTVEELNEVWIEACWHAFGERDTRRNWISWRKWNDTVLHLPFIPENFEN